MEGLHQVRKQTTYRDDNASMHLEKESSNLYIDLSGIFTKVEEKEEIHKTERIFSINSTLMKEPHYVKMQTSYDDDDPGIYRERYKHARHRFGCKRYPHGRIPSSYDTGNIQQG